MTTLPTATNPSYIRRAVMATGQFEKVRVSSANGDVFVKEAGKPWRFYATTEQVSQQIHAEHREKYGSDARKLYEAAGLKWCA